MPSKARESWGAVSELALGGTPKDSFGAFLARIRSKVLSHYDAEEILQGYQQFFKDPTTQKPYISPGDTMASTRFYFSDAAAQGYLEFLLGQNAVEFMDQVNNTMGKLNEALMILVHRFIQKRGFTYSDAA